MKSEIFFVLLIFLLLFYAISFPDGIYRLFENEALRTGFFALAGGALLALIGLAGVNMQINSRAKLEAKRLRHEKWIHQRNEEIKTVNSRVDQMAENFSLIVKDYYAKLHFVLRLETYADT